MTAFVYVIGEQGSSIVKIGTTKDLTLRLTALQTGNPTPLVILWSHEGDRELEGHLHATFAAHRVRGEWFDLTPLGDPAGAVQGAVAAAESHLLPAPRTSQAARINNVPAPAAMAPDAPPALSSADLAYNMLARSYRPGHVFELWEAAETIRYSELSMRTVLGQLVEDGRAARQGAYRSQWLLQRYSLR